MSKAIRYVECAHCGETVEALDAMRTTEAVSLLFILFCCDPQFRRSLYKLDPVLFRRFTNGEVWL
nr:MAG TPA: zinc-ribbon domain protein [Caudoviricetes sp.]